MTLKIFSRPGELLEDCIAGISSSVSPLKNNSASCKYVSHSSFLEVTSIEQNATYI